MSQLSSTNHSLSLLTLGLSLLALALGCSEPLASDAGSAIDSGVLQVVSAPDAAPAPVAARVAQPSPQVLPAEAETVEPIAPAMPMPQMAGVHNIVRRAALARDVVNREPVDPKTEFRAGAERLYAFFDLANPADEELEIQVRFERPDHTLTPPITLLVPPSARRFRTWAYTRGARRPGAWAAIAETSDGTEVARLPFTIVE